MCAVYTQRFLNSYAAEAPGESRASSGVATVLRIERPSWSPLGSGEQAARLTFEFDHEGAKNVNREDYH